MRKLKKKQERERERDEGAKKRVRAQVIVSLLGPCMPTPQAATLQTVQRHSGHASEGAAALRGAATQLQSKATADALLLNQLEEEDPRDDGGGGGGEDGIDELLDLFASEGQDQAGPGEEGGARPDEGGSDSELHV